jgi:hypothetical protein
MRWHFVTALQLSVLAKVNRSWVDRLITVGEDIIDPTSVDRRSPRGP